MDNRVFYALLMLIVTTNIVSAINLTHDLKMLAKKALKSLEPSNPDAFYQAMKKQQPRAVPSTSIAANRRGSGATTIGLVTQLMRFARPLSQIWWLLVDSWLRNTRNKALPCTIVSIAPLVGYCTPLSNA